MPIATTAAIIGGAALAGGAVAAVSSRQQSKAAASAARNQQNFLAGQNAPANRLAELQANAFEKFGIPDLALESKIFQRFGEEEAEIANLELKRGVGLREDVFEPQLRGLSERLTGAFDEELGIPEELSDRIFQMARRRTIEAGRPTRQRLSERLASRGSLDSGAAEQAFRELDVGEAQSLEDLAFNQALAEFDIARSQRQQNIENVFGLLGEERQPVAPARGGVSVPTSGVRRVGAEEFVDIPRVGVNFGDIVSGGVRGAKLGAGFADFLF